MTLLFCPRCGTYLGRALTCDECGYRRSPVERPCPPGQAFWRVKVPGTVGSHLTLVEVGGRALLLVPWSQRPKYRPAFGGVVALDARTGEEVWSWQTDGPVEAGVSTAGDAVIVPVRDTVGSSRIVALDLYEGQERWRIPVSAAVVNTPVVREQRIYFAADDGTLHVVDTRTLQEVPGFPVRVTPAPVPIRASPLLLARGREEIVIVATYGRDFDRVPGDVVAYDMAGREQWRQPISGTARATPTLVGRWLYVTAYRAHPSTGVLSALDAFNGTPLWPQPFQVQAQPGGRQKHYFSASPLVLGNVVYVTSLDHHLYAVDARTGRLLWSVELPRSIATQPVEAQGLLLVVANDARVHAVDLAQQARLADAAIVLEEDLSRRLETETSLQGRRRARPRVHATTQPLLWNGVLFAAASDGTVVAVPWHLGQYAWVAERLRAAGHHREAGDYFALAAHFASSPAEREHYTRQAMEAWKDSEALDRVGAFHLARGEREMAAEAFLQAGHLHQHRHRERAIRAARQALRLFQHLRHREGLVQAMHLLSQMVGLPFVRVEGFVVARYRLWERGRLELRITNEGRQPARNIRLRLGGSLERSVEITFDQDLAPDECWIVPMEIVPTREESRLDVEVMYDCEQPRVAGMVLTWSIPLEAERPPTPPPEIKIGDVGYLNLEIAATTREGVGIRTRDVGVIRGPDMGDILAEGDIGMISAGGEIGSVGSQGDVGIIRERPSSKVRVCSQGHENPPDARFCRICGEQLI